MPLREKSLQPLPLLLHTKEPVEFGKNRWLLGLLSFAMVMSLFNSPAWSQDRAKDKSPESKASESIQAEYDARIRPFVQKHCVSCHGTTKPEGELNLEDGLAFNFADPVAKSKWNEVVDVLNSHQMPPETEPQPPADQVAQVVDWITGQLAAAEAARRDSAIIMRRLNREEYRNTIRDLTGIEFDVSGFPLDAAAGGFDNNGQALTVSPLLMELYFNAARAILDEALVEGGRPDSIRWRFEPESGNDDSNRVRYGEHNAIVNGGNNPVQGKFKVLHHNSWDKTLNARDFALPTAGTYIVRVHGAGDIPDRQAVIESAKKALGNRRDEQMSQNPNGAKWHNEQYENDLKHFETDRMYNYGPPRVKLVHDLAGQPRTVAEFDLDGTLDSPHTHEFRIKSTNQRMGLTIEYAYSIPSVLENFWFQNHDVFARPTAYVDWFEIEGPVYDEWPPKSHRMIMIDSPDKDKNERDYARQVLTRFMRRAYRRPLSKEEIDEKMKLYDTAREDRQSLVQAIKTPLIAVLCSPHFLYLTEPRPSSVKEARRLNDHELAARLSYFLWSSMPDDELFRVASSGKLREPETLKAQMKRLLADSKSEAFVINFAGQWLGLREVGANPPAADLYPHYDRHLETSMVAESFAFFDEILRNDLSAMNLVYSDFVVINERLARFYGIENVRGDQFRRVPVPETVPRGGVVTQAAIHTITSNGTRTSPVKRGTWVLKNLLGTDPGLPVANAGDIAPKVPGIDKATVRKRLEIHRSLPQCARCHNKIDPLGLALENFNASGEWREQEGFGYKGRIERDDPKIDASAKLPDGTTINGVKGLQKALLAKEDLFLQCLANKMLTYALARELSSADDKTVKQAVTHMKQNGYTLNSLIEFIVVSDSFALK